MLINSSMKVLSSKPAIIHTTQITLKEVKDALLSDNQGLEFLYAQNLESQLVAGTHRLCCDY